MNSIRHQLFLAGMLLVTGLAACSGINSAAVGEILALPETTETIDAIGESDSTIHPENWSVETHGNDAEPNYEVVFPEDKVNQIKITIAPEEWEKMQANMTELFGEAGTGDEGRRGPAGPRQAGDDGFPERPEGFEPQDGLERPAPPDGGFPDDRPGGGFRGGDMTPVNPDWVPATIEFEGDTWTNVGIRYKGNSSLTSGWRSGTLKLPFKLDFDEFEDEYPEIEDQRFYGFKQLSLANGFSDNSFLRDAATASILEESGLPAAKTAFYEVVLDYGEGPVSLGLYTMIEVIDDTVVEGYFGSDDGNIYDADGSAASFAESSYSQIEQSFQKENNQDEADWSDIEGLFDVLHSDQRINDPSAWRDSLEAVFNVEGFLKWVAISAVIEHWDAYGNMTHNYYLYHDPDTDQLIWISWDHNMAMSAGMGGGRGPGGRGVSLDKVDVDDNWPLIRFLLDDPIYYKLYLGYLEETIEGPFNPDQMAERYRMMAKLIAPYATADVGETIFNEAIQTLIDHAYERTDAVEEFLASIEP